MKKQGLMTRDEQRRKRDALLMLSVRLELQLRQLIRNGLMGDRESIQEFQQLVQYAPSEMKGRLQTLLDTTQ